MGHDVVGRAASGEDALRLAEELRPECVLMDIQLQGEMSGTDVARAIQRNTGAQIIFVTAYAGVFVRDPTQMPPPGICLSKPFSQSQLEAALSAVQQQRSS
jgi:CheY-like chemotaxis protein